MNRAAALIAVAVLLPCDAAAQHKGVFAISVQGLDAAPDPLCRAGGLYWSTVTDQPVVSPDSKPSAKRSEARMPA